MSENKKSAHGGNRGRAAETVALTGKLISLPQYNIVARKPQGQIEARLPRGAANAVPARALAAHLGYRSVRQLQKAIEAERRGGAIILTRTGGGYYVPADGERGRAEIAEFIRTLDARARHTQMALKSARAALRELDGQARIDLPGGGEAE